MSLRSALRDLESVSSLTEAKRRELRRGWCEFAAVALQDVRVRALQLDSLTAEADVADHSLRTIEAALAEAETLVVATEQESA